MVSGIGTNTHLAMSSTKGTEKGTVVATSEVKDVEKTKAQEIKEQIKNGTYKVNLQKTAEEMASYLLG